ncbi:MAG: hypothetical protein ACPGXX_01600 [Planctomycetaceae bacterium]
MNRRHETIRSRRLITLISLAAVLVALPGCGLIVSAGKLLFGDPKTTCAFRRSTGVDLEDGDHRVLVVCDTPYSVQSHFPTLRMDVVEHMTRELHQRGIDVVESDDIADWIDNHGGWGDLSELAEESEVDYLVHIEVQSFAIDVPGSDALYQGKLSGRVQVTDFGHSSGPRLVMEETYAVTWPRSPTHRAEGTSRQMFADRFIRDVSSSFSQLLYDYRVSEAVY